MSRPSAYQEGIRLLARHELSVVALRARLLDREHSEGDVEAAIAHLLETGALDDRRVARSYARTAVQVKGRGRLRVQHELHEMGIAKEIASEALGEVFGDVDERTLVARALKKKLQSRPGKPDAGERARLYRYLMHLGFSPDAIRAALKPLGGGGDSIE